MVDKQTGVPNFGETMTNLTASVTPETDTSSSMSETPGLRLSEQKVDDDMDQEADSGMYNDAMSITKSMAGSDSFSQLRRDAHPTVLLNVGGTNFEVDLVECVEWVCVSTLKRYPNTRLARLAEDLSSDESYRPVSHDYYFDRNVAAFTDILEYYRCGELHMDQASCGAIFRRELDFWEISVEEISRCCWSRYDNHRATTTVYKQLDQLFEGPKKVTKPRSQQLKDRLQFYLFHTLEDPSFSGPAKIFVLFATLVTLMSVFTFVAETHHYFRVIELENGTLVQAPAPVEPDSACCCAAAEEDHHEEEFGVGYFTNATDHGPEEEEDDHEEEEGDHEEEEDDDHHGDDHGDDHVDSDSGKVLHHLDWVAFGYFVFELTLRFIVAYEKKRFCKNAYNIIEALCVVAHCISLIEHRINIDNKKTDAHDRTGETTFFLKALRVMRIVRVFRLYRNLNGFKILVYTMLMSAYELFIVFGFLFTAVLIFASLIYYAEEDTFYSIPYATWWALVTMTTVGYGDVTPKSNTGYLIGSLCVASGAMVVAFTVPIVVNNFTLYYSTAQSRKAMEKIGNKGNVARAVVSKWMSKRRDKIARIKVAPCNPAYKIPSESNGAHKSSGKLASML